MDRDELVLRHRDWARKIALRYRGRGLSDDDLVGEAMLALVQAAGEYDPEEHPDASFASYAVIAIRNQIADALARSSVLRMPRRLERAAARCKQALAALWAAGEPRPTMAQVAAEAELDEELCRQALRRAEMSVSVESLVVLPDIPDPDQQRLLDLVEEVLDRCTELGRQVLMLCRVEEMSLGQVARRLGRPLGEVRRAHDDACLTVADEMRRRGWSETTWAAAIA